MGAVSLDMVKESDSAQVPLIFSQCTASGFYLLIFTQNWPFFVLFSLNSSFIIPSYSPSIYATLPHTIKNLLLHDEEMCCKETPSFERTVGGITLNDSHYIDDHWIFDYQHAKREHTCVISLLLKPSGDTVIYQRSQSSL